jgi:DNA-binding MarR family transcriptional regulator
MCEAHQEYGYTLKCIIEYIGVHYSTVSKMIKRTEGEGKM